MIKTKSKKTTAKNRKKLEVNPFLENSNPNEDNESGPTEGITGLYHPGESDVMDELSRFDSYQYGKYIR